MELTDRQIYLIQEGETVQKYGYAPKNLTRGSPKKIVHLCDMCGCLKETPFRSFLLGIGIVCCKCGYLKRKQTFLTRYGVDNPNKCPEIREKVAQTCFKRFGTRSPSQCEEVQEKMRQTNLKRYGVPNAFQNKILQEKQKKTNLDRYGVENPFKSLEMKQRLKQSWLSERGITSSLDEVDMLKKQYIEQKLKEEEYVLLSSEYKRSDEKIHIQCPQGHLFWMRWMHFWNMGQRCPHCLYKNQTKLQEILEGLYPSKVLHNNNLGFLGRLKVDFCIFDIKLAVEYDGEQHYKPIIGRFGMKTLQEAEKYLLTQQRRDNCKDKLCRENGWNIVRFKYNEGLTCESVRNKIVRIMEAPK